MAALHDLTALEQAAAVRRREVSPVDLVDHYLDRIERLGDEVGAFVRVTADRAREEAKAAEAAVVAGGDLPPLHGVPIAIKDLNFVAGIPATMGSRVYAEGLDLGFDDNVVVALRRAGTISLGKTNTPEFGLPCYTEPDVAPPARTAWDLTRSAGGSSGGAGAAVAAGLLPFAHGNDGAGSIRIPSSACGLVGLKPSRGRISNGPAFPEGPGLAVQGPMARTVRDAAALLDAMAGPFPDDMTWAPPLPAGETFLAACERPPGRLRVGRYRTPVIADVQVDDECIAGYDATSALLADLGHEVVDIEPPFGPHLVHSFVVMWQVGPATLPLEPAQEELLQSFTRWIREEGRRHSGVDYAGAVAALHLTTRLQLAVTAEYDVVLTPTLSRPPVPVGFFTGQGDDEANFEAQKRFASFTAPYNLSGQPAITLPLHWTADGLPVGMQLVGRPTGEATLLSLAAQLEAARPWADRRPACW
jgi:amidase